jgi:hypothetical protein
MNNRAPVYSASSERLDLLSGSAGCSDQDTALTRATSSRPVIILHSIISRTSGFANWEATDCELANVSILDLGSKSLVVFPHL